MKFKYRPGLISQILIILTFVSGMMANFFMLRPLLLNEIDSRVLDVYDRYVNELLLDYSECGSFEVAIKDSTKAPEFNGRMFIVKRDSLVFNATEFSDSELESMARQHNGSYLFDLTKNTYRDGKIGMLALSDFYHDSLYAREADGFTFVILFNYMANNIGGVAVKAFYNLLAIMLVGGVLLIFVCFSIMRRLRDKKMFELTNAKDLEAAASIQRSMLPKGHIHLMQLDIDARLITSQKVGGDLYSYLLKNGYLYFCIGDVSGKGIPSALFMSRAITMFRSLAQDELSPADIVSRMNKELSTDNEQFFFITAIVGKIRTSDGFLTYCNAGHEAPVYWDGDTSIDYMKMVSGLPLGFDAGSKYEEGTATMAPDAMLMFYTDGVDEAKNRSGEQFGHERMLVNLRRLKELGANEINTGILEAVNEFVGKAPQFDDITLLTFRNIHTPKRMTISNSVSDLRELSGFLDAVFKECAIDGKAKIRIRSGLDEALTNCVNYAYPSGEGRIKVSAFFENGFLSFRIKDFGIPFNPLKYNPELTEEVKVGGLGIQMMRSVFDGISYSRTPEGENILTMKIKIN